MILTLVQLLIALSLLIVETVIAIAVHSHFSRPLETIKSWFLAHRRLSLRVILPVLLVLNFGMAVLFSFTLGAPEGTDEQVELEEPSGIARDFFETLPELKQPRVPEPKQQQAEEPRIMKGLPADSTLNIPSLNSGSPENESPSAGKAPEDQ
ncbi:hypothetical protein B4O97_10090 [Marispirochaeta aestuarii]|uniref:Uncharacterized protein n=1 Tax=Marispirochaeta aestuarii TaxID=1963862 RepID=A0A1Y1RYQ8_9SPIO|nr:hypothetical protein [Marispirochaeta aestuarii]ORC35078.1 hypothetical protein B4O97_10090 [Marispirochaeta aestuarii]